MNQVGGPVTTARESPKQRNRHEDEDRQADSFRQANRGDRGGEGRHGCQEVREDRGPEDLGVTTEAES